MLPPLAGVADVRGFLITKGVPVPVAEIYARKIVACDKLLHALISCQTDEGAAALAKGSTEFLERRIRTINNTVEAVLGTVPV